jgi:hypothetical protein
MAGLLDRYFGGDTWLYDPAGDCCFLRHRKLQLGEHGLADQLVVRAGLARRALPDLRVAP